MDHVGHHHDHDHGHGHSHDHHHETDEYVEQLLSIGICGAFGIVAVILGYHAINGGKGMLALLLVPQFFPWVLGGGVILLAIACIRSVILWRKAGHVHTSSCDHSHEEHSHAHGAAWKTVVLIFPLILFFLGLPNQSFSKDRLAKMLDKNLVVDEASLQDVQVRNDISASFEDIANAMRSNELMEAMTGNMVTVRGQLQMTNDRQFTLFTTKMTCCASDTVPLKAKIIVRNDEAGGSLKSRNYRDFQWLEVKGVIQFIKMPNHDQYLPVIQAKLKDINETPPE